MTRWLLLIDTCGDHASVALMRNGAVHWARQLPERTASAGLLGAIREALESGGIRLEELGGVGVVNGPGSFTGLRIGLAVGKGLCEAARLPMAAVSRLEVLLETAGVQTGVAVLRASRGEVYVRESRPGEPPREFMTSVALVRELAGDAPVVCGELNLREELPAGVHGVLCEMSAENALPAVERCLDRGGSDVANADASYVRNEEGIYARHRAGA